MLFSSIPVRATVPDELCPAGQDPCIVNTTRGRDVVTNDVVRANAAPPRTLSARSRSPAAT
jgi:hypothetical protein